MMPNGAHCCCLVYIFFVALPFWLTLSPKMYIHKYTYIPFIKYICIKYTCHIYATEWESNICRRSICISLPHVASKMSKQHLNWFTWLMGCSEIRDNVIESKWFLAIAFFPLVLLSHFSFRVPQSIVPLVICLLASTDCTTTPATFGLASMCFAILSKHTQKIRISLGQELRTLHFSISQ